jgi:hypothetical protein
MEQTAAGKDRMMPKVLDNVIVAATANATDYTVALTWANGETSSSSFRDRVGQGVFAELADPSIFAEVRVGERGRSLEWPGDIDFCTDTL